MSLAKLTAMALAIAGATLGGLAARALGLPLPWLLGGLAVTTALAITNIRPYGEVVGLPAFARPVFVPILGVSIGSAVTPGLLSEVPAWWPSLAALLVYVPLAHFIGYWFARRTGAGGPANAFYGTMPGGFIEAITMAESAGADVPLISVMQFLRLIICIVLIPVGFSLLTGAAVGSAGGMVIGTGALSMVDWIILAAAGAIGATVARALNVPAWMIAGPFLASGAVHLFGIVEGGPPGWLIGITQAVIGITLGQRFAGRDAGVLLQGLRIALVTTTASLLLSALFAWGLHSAVGEDWRAVFLAFAPGGLPEMSLVALSLEISVIYVTAHHVVRIIVAVITARLASNRLMQMDA